MTAASQCERLDAALHDAAGALREHLHPSPREALFFAQHELLVLELREHLEALNEGAARDFFTRLLAHHEKLAPMLVRARRSKRLTV